ncbi:peptidoglycan D,D-transpeptidase FtsI family protein [Alkalibacillus haloalkaliphilus]|uniref:peptidoglycan D,D-transpeptidase FtsI family protein n=1 Tax=Alkalibacillus haloalkaliphilus TaxID=94136 RepID=UPI0029366D86|nr:penicillin-binding protein 2 [Alkalibacillus haloalkaliphilus]MDV2580993.1 penicillin-binding protein 2 [Alkalibacillus haloalkaliphilus]
MKNKESKSHLPLRLNLLFFLIFLLFSMLILQLGVVQILYGQDAQEEIDRTDQDTSETPVPRGRMFDRTGELIVDNEPILAITYTPPKNVQPDDNLEIAEQLVDYIEVTPDGLLSRVTERDVEDYWILKNFEEAYSRLDDEELELSDSEQYQLVLDRVTDEDLADISDEEMNVIALFRELNQASALTPHIIKRDIENDEYAVIAENLNRFPGINVTTDWDRVHLFGGSFSNLIGGITTTRQGIPDENSDYFLSRNYSRNDRVGISGLEDQYEQYLAGQKEVREHITDSNGNVISSELIREGERGKDLVLSVDMELQQRLDDIVGEELTEAIEEHPSEHLNHAMAVMMDPNTGEILAMSGQTYERGEEEESERLSDEAYRAVYDAYEPGSTIKGATVLAGFEEGVISPGEVMNDRTVRLPPGQGGGDLTFSSHNTLGSLDDIGALRESSNVYMGFIALRIHGEMRHQYDFSNTNMTHSREGFQTLINYYSQFGLGVETGIDLPYETTGNTTPYGTLPDPGLQMQFSIGQYFEYSALQLGQYVSTIANDGYRIAPSLVRQMHSAGDTDGLGPLYKANEPKILNRLDMDDHYIERVQEGFRQGFQESSGTGSTYFGDKDYNPAGKTGTAEAEIYERGELIAEVNNLNLVGYAPFDDPEVAFAVVVPHTDPNSDHQTNLRIGERALDAYFELQEERQGTTEEELEDEVELEEDNSEEE